MSDVIAAFFDELGTRGNEPLLKRATGAFGFEITGKRPEHWHVDVRKGDITISHAGGKADCMVRADREVFEAILTGRANAFAATLRGAASIDGDVSLLAMFQRLLPGPPPATP